MKQEADPSEVILIEWWDLNKFSQVLCSSSKQRDMKRGCSQLQINPYPKMWVSVPQKSTVTNAGSWIIWIGDRSVCYALSSSRSIRWQEKPWNRQMLYISRANTPIQRCEALWVIDCWHLAVLLISFSGRAIRPPHKQNIELLWNRHLACS
jgi:hypothetical protein